LFQLEVAIRIDKLIFLVVEEDEGDDGPEDLEVSFEFYKDLEGHVGYRGLFCDNLGSET
jgi:hypothetical protein